MCLDTNRLHVFIQSSRPMMVLPQPMRIYSYSFPPSTDYVLPLSSADNIFYIPRRSAREEYKKALLHAIDRKYSCYLLNPHSQYEFLARIVLLGPCPWEARISIMSHVLYSLSAPNCNLVPASENRDEFKGGHKTGFGIRWYISQTKINVLKYCEHKFLTAVVLSEKMVALSSNEAES
jgi:hypothetical protein